MKKLVLLVLTCLFMSCDGRPYTPASDKEVAEHGGYIIEFTSRGEAHEYLLYANGESCGLTHLPNCKYCINSSIARTELLLEGEELHEVWIITRDTIQITDHCDDCRYCKTDNPEGNPE